MFRRFIADLIDDIEIDWWGFATTRGGWNMGLYSLPFGRREVTVRSLAEAQAEQDADELRTLVASGGFCPPSPPPFWDEWQAWMPPVTQRVVDMLPKFTAPRGPIRYLSPPG